MAALLLLTVFYYYYGCDLVLDFIFDEFPAGLFDSVFHNNNNNEYSFMFFVVHFNSAKYNMK